MVDVAVGILFQREIFKMGGGHPRAQGILRQET